ncbi:MAG: cob(I)yrinic acid a,c-diamide adenosyltransferase [Acidimicrobiales bacterium]
MSRVRIYTKKGDDGTTGLLYGGRVRKDAARIELNGAVDEAQAALGLARAESRPGSELANLLVELERQLYVLMAEVATAPANRHKLVAGESIVTPKMVAALEGWIDQLIERFEMPKEFVLPGANRCSAALDVARTLVRRAERVLVSAGPLGPHGAAGDSGGVGGDAAGVGGDAAGVGGDAGDGGESVVSQVGPYLNRLSDLLWAMARWQEGEVHLAARQRLSGIPGEGDR